MQSTASNPAGRGQFGPEERRPNNISHSCRRKEGFKGSRETAEASGPQLARSGRVVEVACPGTQTRRPSHSQAQAQEITLPPTLAAAVSLSLLVSSFLPNRERLSEPVLIESRRPDEVSPEIPSTLGAPTFVARNFDRVVLVVIAAIVIISMNYSCQVPILSAQSLITYGAFIAAFFYTCTQRNGS
jgi:hypothetical protein